MRRIRSVPIHPILRVVGLSLVALAVATATASAQPARPATPPAAAAERELTVVNKSSRTVNELYVSPSSADQWGDDRLGDDTIDPGKSYRAHLGRARDCEFDVQVVYDDASHEESRHVNVCRTRQLAFDGTTAVAPPAETGSAHGLTLLNQSARPIQQVFISPADSTQWGDDRIGDDSISVGDRTTLQYHGECVADLRVIFDNKGAEERRGVNLCDTPTISIQPGWTTADALPTGGPATPPTPAPVPPTSAVPAPRRTEADPFAHQAPSITVTNHSGQPAVELYVFPEGRGDHGRDWLGMDTLADGGQTKLPLEAGAGCKFAAHVVYGGKTPDQDLTGLDLCASPQIVLAAH